MILSYKLLCVIKLPISRSLQYLSACIRGPPPPHTGSTHRPTRRTPIPSQRSVIHQLIQHWDPYAQLRQQVSGTRQMEQLSLHFPRKIVATGDSSALREEMCALEPQEENAKPRNLLWKPMSWLGDLSSRGLAAAWVLPLWQTFVCIALGMLVPILAALHIQPSPSERRVQPVCLVQLDEYEGDDRKDRLDNQFDLDFYGDHAARRCH